MPITTSDIKYRFSVKTGSAGNSQTGTGAGSLGKYISTTDLTDGLLHNLFDVVTGDENAASDVEYRCIFILNDHPTLTYENVVVWVSGEVAGGATNAIGLDTTAVSLKTASSAQALEVADEGTAPVGVSFSAPTTKGTGLSIGNIAALSCKAVWVRRTAANTAAVDNDGVTINVSGDTAA